MDRGEQLQSYIHSAEYRDAMLNPPAPKPDPGPGKVVYSAVLFPDGTTRSLESYEAAKRETLAVPKMATMEDVEQAETLISFPVPEFVRRLYLEVRNGGFASYHHPVLDIATVAREYIASRSSHERTHPEWPPRLLPLCDWGCNIYSCVDCAAPNLPVIRVDHNSDEPQMRREYVLNSDFRFFESYTSDEVAAWVEAATVEGWFGDRLAGGDLFHGAYPQREPRSEHREAG